MRRLVVFIFLTFLFQTATAQLYPIKKNGLWGAIDLQGRVIITAEYDFVRYSKKSDRVLVSQKGQYGIFDSQGQVVVPITFDYLKFAQNGFIYALKGGAWGLLSNSGQTILKPEYRQIKLFNQTLFRAYKPQGYGLVDLTGAIVLENKCDQIQLLQDKGLIKFRVKDLYGLSSVTGNPILDASATHLTFGENYVVAQFPDKSLKVFDFKSDRQFTSSSYPNRVAWNLERKKRARQIATQKIAANPLLKEPRWQRFNIHYQLTNGLSKPLLPYKFYDVMSDQQNGKSLARYFDQKTQTFECFYIDLQQSKVLWRVKAKYVSIADFKDNNWARATVDTLFDALIDERGRLVSTIRTQNEFLKFKDLGNFREGLAWVYDGKKYGYLNTKLELIVPFILERASDFKNGLAIVKHKNNFGCIDKTGKTVLKYEYQGITTPSEGLVCVKKGRGKKGLWGAVNLKGETVIPFTYTRLQPFKNGFAKAQKDHKYWGVIDKNNKVSVPLKIACSQLSDFKNGIAKVVRNSKSGRPKMGYVNLKGDFIIPPNYDHIENFDSIWNLKRGLAKIWNRGRFGYVDYEGRLVAGAAFSDMGDFEINWGKHKQNSRAKIDQFYGLLDYNGDTILPFRYCYLGDNFEEVWQGEGILKACLYDKFGYIKQGGAEVINFNYDYISDLIGSYVLVQKGDKWGVIDTLEDVSITLDYAKIDLIPQSSNLVRLAKDKPTYYYYNQAGELTRFIAVEKAPPLQVKKKVEALYSPNYDHVTPFDKDGLAVIKNPKKNNLKAILSKTGKLVSKYIYVDLGPFKEDLAFAKLYNKKDRRTEKYGFINRAQEFSILAEYTAAQSFSEGLAAVAKAGKWGYIDQKGKVIVPFQYNRVTPFEGGYALVDDTKIIDQTGRYLGTLEYAYQLKTAFEYERAIAKFKGFEKHVRPDGLPAYAANYDEVTPFLNKVAFVKKGEQWILSRETPTGMRELRFTKQQKIAYLNKYGSKRQHKDKYGNYFVDKGWEKVKDGKWRLINRDGYFVNDFVFDSLEVTATGYRAKLTRFYGLSQLDGTFLTELDYPVIRRLDGVLKIESKNKIGYLKMDGAWLWEPTD